MRSLRPSISTIEARLCGPSDALLEQYCTDPLSLEEELRRQIELDEDAQDRARYRVPEQDLLRVEDTEAADVGGPSLAQIHELHALLDRRKSARTLEQTQRPSPGQVRLVQRIVQPRGGAECDLPAPLAVVLNEPTADESEIWYAWLASPDRDYASPWDLILEDDVVDPLAAVVQCWNSVLLYLPPANVVMGQLSESSLAAARALAEDYAFGPDMDPGLAVPGQSVYRVVDGLRALTGTPLGEDDADPRFDYQRLYHEAGQPLRDFAQEALGLGEQLEGQDVTQPTQDIAALVRNSIGAVIDRLRELAAEAALEFKEVDLVPNPASAEPSGPERCVELANVLRVHIYRRVAHDLPVLHARLTRLGAESVVVELVQDGIVTDGATLTDRRPILDVPLSGDGDLVLRIKSPVRLDVPMPKTDG